MKEESRFHNANNNFFPFKYKALFISDLHLGSGKTATPYLYEFLSNIDFHQLERLYLVGDIIGGWERQSEKQKPFPEMEKRIFDVLNYAAANGVKIHYIPGNHDEKVRRHLVMLSKRRHFSVFHENVVFENESFFETGGRDGIRIKIVHGDQHDPDLFVRPWFRPVTALVSALYDGLVKLNYIVSGFYYERFGIHVSFAKKLKNTFKNMIGFFFSHDSLVDGLKNADFDGILMGHTHMAGIQAFENDGRKSYLINDGDWVESATAAYINADGGMPQILNYKTEREVRGFSDLPDASDPHPAYFAAFRAQTERQMRLIQALWPSCNRSRVLDDLRHAARKLEEHCEDRRKLNSIMQDLETKAVCNRDARSSISEIFSQTKAGMYRVQKDGLYSIFNKYSCEQAIEGEDLVFVRTVVREFSARSERKIRKHEEAVAKAADKLDFKV